MNLEVVFFAQLDDAVENRFPVAIACEVVVGNEESGNPSVVAGPDQTLYIVGAAVARLPPLNVDYWLQPSTFQDLKDSQELKSVIVNWGWNNAATSAS